MFKPTGTFEAPSIPNTLAYRDDPARKKLFAIELSKGLKPIDAALNVFPENAGAALWVSQNWLNDPLVLHEPVKQQSKLLDKEGLAARVLAFADEKDLTNRFYVNEGKDRLAAFKLYSDIMGFTKDQTLGNNITNNGIMKIELVSPIEQEQKEQPKIIEHNQNNIIPLNNIKLVS